MDEFNKDPRKNDKNKSLWVTKMRKGFKKVVAKDGFYIILFICICIVGTTAVWVSSNNVDKTEKVKETGNKEERNESKVVTEHKVLEELATLDKLDKLDSTKEEKQDESPTKDETSVEVVNIKDTPKDNKTQKSSVDSQQPEKQKDESNKEEPSKSNKPTGYAVETQKQAVSMVTPLNGVVTKGFAMDRLVYSKTLEQWTTHSGMDISARKGSVVRASLDGVVSSMNQDNTLGIVITIDHGDGLVTKYACVSTDKMVQVGQEVKKGDPISGVGDGTGFELAQGSHLHFEVLKNGKHVDPKQYLPIIN